MDALTKKQNKEGYAMKNQDSRLIKSLGDSINWLSDKAIRVWLFGGFVAVGFYLRHQNKALFDFAGGAVLYTALGFVLLLLAVSAVYVMFVFGVLNWPVDSDEPSLAEKILSERYEEEARKNKEEARKNAEMCGLHVNSHSELTLEHISFLVETMSLDSEVVSYIKEHIVFNKSITLPDVYRIKETCEKMKGV